MLIREYRPEDDAACRALEARASNQAPPWMKYIVDFQFMNFGSFDTRVLQFELGGVTLVADSPAEGIVGTICGAVKEVRIAERVAKVCYLFDLRVCPKSRRGGLGARLSTEVERICQERFGCERMYLTVNKDNVRARGLYEKLGYTIASVRAPSAKPCAGAPATSRQDRKLQIATLRGEEAARAFALAHKDTDCAPLDFLPLVQSPNFLGLVRCASGGSEAGVGLWDSAALSGFAVSRLIFPASWYFSPVGKAIGLLCVVGAPLLWGRLLWSCLQAGLYKWSIFLLTLGGGAVFLAWKGLPFLRAFSNIMYQSFSEEPVARMRGRLFAPWARGPEGRRLLDAVLRRAERQLADAGFVFRICNLDQAHPLRDAFGPKSFVTHFLQKNLLKSEGELPAWAPDNFHDPRDI